MRTTKLFVVLNEETLNTMKGFGGKTAKFATEEEANLKAAGKLTLWIVVGVHFNHKWVQHTV
tara:strand:+ start:651 stop:836 length:186 start_codon:yes stop_codon:yes gene_type:complete